MGRVYPIPMLPDAASPMLAEVRRAQANNTAKVATRDLLLTPLPFPVDLATSMTIDDMAATEIINTARHDLISGTNPNYKAIGKLSLFNSKYTPMKILALSDGTPEQFNKFNLNFDFFMPQYDDNAKNVYLDSSNNIVIEVVNVGDGQFVEVEIVSQGDVYDIL
jgi:hypothetical protein